jgi:5-oxoprolinase (ATP-hydrolysing) subunit A
MASIDINCDLGEGIGNDEELMRWISSASIACGYHAGDVRTMWETIDLAMQNSINIGAHVSFHDRQNFGRTEINISVEEIYELVIQQLILISEIVGTLGAKVNHVKPHGALYNLSARDAKVAKAIAWAVHDFDSTLLLYGLSGSYSISEAMLTGLKTANEVFADRVYEDDGSLRSRSFADAVIEQPQIAAQQALQMAQHGLVASVSGKLIPVIADTICIHGDGRNAIEVASSVHQLLKENQLVIKAF